MSSTTVSRVSTWTRFAQRYSALSSAGLVGSKTLSTVTWIARIVAPDLLELGARRAGARVRVRLLRSDLRRAEQGTDGPAAQP